MFTYPNYDVLERYDYRRTESENQLAKNRFALAEANARQLQDLVGRKLLEQGIHYTDFAVHALLCKDGMTQYSIRSINSPVPAELRRVLIDLFNRIQLPDFADEYMGMEIPLEESYFYCAGGSVLWHRPTVLLRLCSEYPSCTPINFKTLGSDAHTLSMLETIKESFSYIYPEIDTWLRKSGSGAEVLFVPGICDVTAEPRIYAAIWEDPDYQSRRQEVYAHNKSLWHHDYVPLPDWEERREKVHAFFRTLLVYESFEDSPCNKAK